MKINLNLNKRSSKFAINFFFFQNFIIKHLLVRQNDLRIKTLFLLFENLWIMYLENKSITPKAYIKMYVTLKI